MNGGQNRRFPRTARAMPEARPKIEREKIRRPRTNDLLFDEGDAPGTRQSHLTDNVEQGTPIDDSRYEDTGEDWTAEESESEEASVAWDHDPEDDWVLDGDDRGRADDAVEVFEGGEDVHDDFEDESGVVWEDEALPEEHPGDSPDELSFGSPSESENFAPEVELAGRRDVRPKAPRPIQEEPRTRGPGQQQRQQRPPQGRPQVRQPQPDWDDSNEPIASQHGFRKPAFEARQRPTGPTQADDAQFSRTRATVGGAAGALVGGPDEEVLEQPRSNPPQRRRQAQPAPAQRRPAPASPRSGKRNASRSGKAPPSKGLIAAVLLVLIAGIGWFAYQSAGPDGVRSMLDRLSALVPLPGSSRTAADTSFGGQDTNDTGAVSAEQAISNLEQRLRQQESGQAAPAARPPIPQFKPLPGATRSLSVTAPTETTDDAQLAATNQDAASGDEQINGLSIFEKLWSYLSPG